MRAFLAAALVAAALAGCLSGDDGSSGGDAGAAEEPFTPRVVVAILDTGLNPYHDEFRQLRAGEDAAAHPSTYLGGYPADVQPLAISLDLADPATGERITEAEAYLEADQQMWEGAADETLYWLPGTKFVGIIGFDTGLPGGGHGSMTSTRAGGNTVSIPGGEVLLVHVVAPLALEVGTVGEDAQARATRWIADQGWIDIQSHSWGMPFTCAGVATTHLWGWAEAFKYARDRQLVVVAAGNGHGNTGVTPGYPSQCQDNSGVAGVVTVGASDNDGYATWGNWFPAVAADGCDNPAIDEETIDELANTGGGTSSATPFTAGGAAKLVLEARRVLLDPRVGVRDGVLAEAQPGAQVPASGPLADGDFTLDELKAVLFHTAISPPQADPSDGDACVTRLPTGPETPPEAIFPFVGYGEVNHDSVNLGVQVLLGQVPLPERPTEDEAYERDQELRRQVWG